MILTRCPFCTHSNPAGARFCNECGSPLHLLPCEDCGAVSDVLSRVCYRCGAPLHSERQAAPSGAPALVNVGDATAEREATTVALAYGDEPRTSQRRFQAGRPASADIEHQSAWTRDCAAALETSTADEREPLVDSVLLDNDAGERAAPRVSASARPLLTFVVAVAIVVLAALGGYTFIQQGEAPPEALPLQPLIPAPESADMPTTPAEPPQAREPTLPEADRPTASPPTTSWQNPSPPTADASPGVTPDAVKAGAPELPPKADRKPVPATSPKPSQDAIETQRIIMRELGGFAPPTR